MLDIAQLAVVCGPLDDKTAVAAFWNSLQIDTLSSNCTVGVVMMYNFELHQSPIPTIHAPVIGPVFAQHNIKQPLQIEILLEFWEFHLCFFVLARINIF